jgi:hypothetical protein
MSQNILLDAAKKINLPSWATHVAVRNTNPEKAEPCAYCEKAQDYLDEDPASLKDGEWSGCYKKVYWTFFSKEQLIQMKAPQK